MSKRVVQEISNQHVDSQQRVHIMSHKLLRKPETISEGNIRSYFCVPSIESNKNLNKKPHFFNSYPQHGLSIIIFRIML